ncbi:MAG: hypothetical protein ACREIC_01535 [Limisphaerales bacterium]
MMRSFALAKWIGLCLAVSVLVGCHRSTSISLHSAGHPISVLVEGNHSIDTEATGAVIRTEHGSIWIERTRATLDGSHWIRIPEGVAVRVGISRHKEWLTAGNVSVRQTSTGN